MGLYAAIAVSAAVLASGNLPLLISRTTTGPMSLVEVRNTADQPITAWSLATTTPSSRGTHRVVETIDGYLSEVTQGLPGSSPRNSRLAPGETRAIAVDPLPADAMVEVIAVVLDDGTAIGDEPTLAAIFERRATERDALRSVVGTFDAVLEGMRGKAALQELARRFRAPSDAAETDPHRAAREAIDSYLRRTTTANDDEIDRLLRGYVEVVRREYQLADRHATRRVADTR